MQPQAGAPHVRGGGLGQAAEDHQGAFEASFGARRIRGNGRLGRGGRGGGGVVHPSPQRRCVRVSVCVSYLIAHNHAIWPCHPSHSIPLALNMCVWLFVSWPHALFGGCGGDGGGARNRACAAEGEGDEDSSNAVKRGTQLLEIFALQILMHSRQRDKKKLRWEVGSGGGRGRVDVEAAWFARRLISLNSAFVGWEDEGICFFFLPCLASPARAGTRVHSHRRLFV